MKRSKDYINLREEDWVADSEAFERQVDLKMKLIDHVPDNYKGYNARWTGQGITTDHIDQLCEEVYEALSGIILREIEEPHEVIIPGKKALIRQPFVRPLRIERRTFSVGRKVYAVAKRRQIRLLSLRQSKRRYRDPLLNLVQARPVQQETAVAI